MSVSTPSEDGFDKYNNAFSLEQVRRIRDEYGCSTKRMGVYKDEYYFDRSGTSGNYAYQQNNWSRWIMNTSHGFTKYGLEKISESIRAYSYLVLTSFCKTRYSRKYSASPCCTTNLLWQLGGRDQQSCFTWGWYWQVSEHTQIRKIHAGLLYRQGVMYVTCGHAVETPQSGNCYNDKLVVNISGLELGKHVEQPKTAKPHLSVSKHIPVRRRTHTLDDHNDEVWALVLAIGGISHFTIWWIH